MNFSEIDQLPAALQAVTTCNQLSKGQVLFHRDEASQMIYAVKTGQIRLLHYTKSGQSISHYAVHPGEICGEVSLFLETYSCTAIAEKSTQMLIFPKQSFLDVMQQSPEFSTAFIMQLTHRLHSTKMMVEIRSIRSAQERVLHYLRSILPLENDTVVLEQSLKDIAADLSISPEALSRTLTQLTSDGAIIRQKRKITLLESSA